MKKPPASDQILQVVYDNGVIRGERVRAGADTIAAFPSVAEFAEHFRKTNLSDLRYRPRDEFAKLSLLHEECEGIAPRPLGVTQTTLLQEFVDGKTLMTHNPFVPTRGVSPVTGFTRLPDLWNMAEGAYAEVQKLHEAGFVHGDMHLDNVVIQKSGKARLIDFESLRQPQSEDEFTEDLEQIVAFGALISRAGHTPGPGEFGLAVRRAPVPMHLPGPPLGRAESPSCVFAIRA